MYEVNFCIKLNKRKSSKS